jgi:hypothetical protein
LFFKQPSFHFQNKKTLLSSPSYILGLQLGAFIAFLLGRTLLKGFAQKQIESSKQMQALSRAVGGKDGFKLVALCRLATVFPFALLNYIFAVTTMYDAVGICNVPPFFLHTQHRITEHQ